ncbi:MAG: acetylglutamate kinase [Alphaproteobacteria bacterium]|nr:acetylglutamate kinase [Alphaproteobacteria bacterium]
MPKKKKNIPDFFINAFYESKFRDSLFVVKAGGKIIEDEDFLENLLVDIRELTMHGINILLVYGGGRAIDEEAAKRGVEIKKTGGKRITDAANMEIVRHVLGGDLSLKVSSGIAWEDFDGLAFNAVPASWMDVTLAPKTPEDLYTGKIERVHARPINRLFKFTNFVATSCLAVAKDGTVCNINADTVATQLAIGVQAKKLIFLSDVDGVQIKGKVADVITAEQIPTYIKDGTVSGGMQVKMENCLSALEGGVKRIHLINGLRKHALHKEIFEPVGPGTMVLKASERKHYMNEVEIQKLIGVKT